MVRYTAKIIAKEILENIDNKKIIFCERDKNLEFIKKYSISQSEIEEIVYSLNESEFVERIKNKDPKIKCEYLYVFNTLRELNDEYGETLAKIFIKIAEIDEGILLVSFHEINNY